jgi:HSP20 family molecular chaperone IbpA
MFVPARRFNFFDDPFFERDERFKPMSTDIIEKDNAYEFHIELPGFKKEDIKIELKDGQVFISAKNEKHDEEKKGGKVIRQERFYGEMSRSFYVGEGVTEKDIDATFKDGVLLLKVPKKEPIEPEKKYIAIK